MKPPILFLATEIYSSPGGIQTHSRRMAEILSLYDGDLRCASIRESGSLSRFIAGALLWSARHRGGTAIAGHTVIAPLAWTLRKLGLIRSYAVILYGIEAWRRLDTWQRHAVCAADAVVAITRWTAAEFASKNGVDADRIRVIPLGLAESGLPGGGHTGSTFEVLTVGRQSASERYKGTDTLIEAVAQLRRAGLDVRLTVAGGGDDLPRLRALGGARFLGTVPDAQLEQLYRDCDVFAMPSRNEGFGIVFLEAMRHGKPCIGGRHGGTPEVIEHGAGGFTVEHGNVEELAACLRALANDPDLTRGMGRKGHEKFQREYRFEHMRDRWLSLLTEIAN